MNNEEKILGLLETLVTKVDKLETGVAELKTGQAELKTEVAELKVGQVKLETGQAKLVKDVKELHVLSKASFDEIDRLYNRTDKLKLMTE